jgi:hypothetical protein
MVTLTLLQAADPAATPGFWQRLASFVDTPLPFSPFSEYLVLLFILWAIARRANRPKPFDTQAQDVLDEKFAQGEISRSAYDKFRQQMASRMKREPR